MSKSSTKKRAECFKEALILLNPKAHHEINNPNNGTKPQPTWEQQVRPYWETTKT